MSDISSGATGSAPSSTRTVTADPAVEHVVKDDVPEMLRMLKIMFESHETAEKEKREAEEKIPKVEVYIAPVSKRQLNFEKKWLDQLLRAVLIESFGTFYPHFAVLSGGLLFSDDPFARAIMIFVSVAISLIISIPISKGHINPAYSCTFANSRGFPWWQVPFYYVGQLLGAIIAAAMFLLVNRRTINERIAKRGASGIDVCSPGGALGLFVAVPDPKIMIWELILWECVYTMCQSIVIWMVMDKNRDDFPTPAAGVFVAVNVQLVVMMAKGVTIALNSVRDLGPRLVAWALFGNCVWQRYAFVLVFATTPAAMITFVVMDTLFGRYGRLLVADLAQVREKKSFMPVFDCFRASMASGCDSESQTAVLAEDPASLAD